MADKKKFTVNVDLVLEAKMDPEAELEEVTLNLAIGSTIKVHDGLGERNAKLLAYTTQNVFDDES